MLTLAAGVVAVLAESGHWWPPVLLCVAVVAEIGYSQLVRLVRVAVPFGAHLSGVDVHPPSRFRSRWVAYGGCAGGVLALLLGLLPLPAWPP